MSKYKMKKLIIPFLIIFCLVGIAHALPMCQDNILVNQNCTLITPMINCGNYTYTIYNVSGTPLKTDSLTNWNGSFYQFDFKMTNSTGDYKIILCDKSSLEIHVVNGGKSSTILAALIIVPMIMALVFALLNSSMDEDHSVLKVFFLLMTFMCFFMSLAIGGIAAATFYADATLQNFVTTVIWIFGGVFFTVVSYFIIYAIWKMTTRLTDDKEKRMNY